MKKRSGFVSNSSSASFIVTWRYKWPEDSKDKTLLGLMADLFELYYDYDEEKNSFKLSDHHLKDKAMEVAIWAEKNTSQSSDNTGGTYTTRDFIGMMNSYADFSEEMFCFFAAIMNDERFVVIKHEIERD